MNAFEKLSRSELHTLEELIQAFAGSLDIHDTLEQCVGQLMAHLHTEAASVFLLDADAGQLVCHACAGPVDLNGLRIPAGAGIVGRTVREGAAQLIRDVRESEDFFGEVDRQSGFTTRSILCAPLSVRGASIGAIELINRIPSADNPAGLFAEADVQLLGILASAAALALHNARLAIQLGRGQALRRELEIARNIQESFLPVFEERHPISGFNRAAHEVSGDFFDYLLLPDGRYVFNIGDVAGKGVEAALLMAKASSLYHCLAKTLKDPGAILGVLNDELCEHATRGLFVTMIGGLYDPASGAVRLANAGHPPALQHHACGDYVWHEQRGIPLGIQPGQEYGEEAFALAQSSLYLYTDGLSEGLTRGRDSDEDDGRARLQALIEQFRDAPRQRRLGLVAEEITLHGSSFDDLTILLLEDSSTHRG